MIFRDISMRVKVAGKTYRNNWINNTQGCIKTIIFREISTSVIKMQKKHKGTTGLITGLEKKQVFF